ncbi:MAG: hypothetical protein H7318_13425 [Oligoflexus sp.]|nr:hypothetical protein [Oligoflexus sp.]
MPTRPSLSSAFIKATQLNDDQYADLVKGAERGWVMYSRMLNAINMP